MAREHKMTEWDAGQDLVACADKLAEKETSLFEGGFMEQAAAVRKARILIGNVFNERHAYKSHQFGLPGGVILRSRRPGTAKKGGARG